MRKNKFYMNGVLYTIKEVFQNKFWENQNDEQDGYYYGQTHFQTQEVWIDKTLSDDKKRKTLYHELTHVYIKEFITTGDIEFNEEVLCDIAANSHNVIHEIVENYFSSDEDNSDKIYELLKPYAREEEED